MKNNNLPEDIFLYATRNRLRFLWNGSKSVEELWDLPADILENQYRVYPLPPRSREGQRDSDGAQCP